jgi:chromosome segregation ATPase
MTLTSEVFASEARSPSYVDDLSGLPRLGAYGDSRSKLPAYYLPEERVQVLVESPRYYSAMDGIAYGDTLKYALESSMGSFVTLDAARSADALYSWPESPLGSPPVGYNALVPVAAPVCYSSLVPVAPSSVVLEQHVEHLHMELEIAREDAKEDVLRVARDAARGLVAEAPLRKENEQLRSEKNKLENSLEQAVASFAEEREMFVAERSQRRASLDRASLEIENSIANAKAQAHAEVEVLHAQLATLVTNQQKLVEDNLGLQETGRQREQAISSLKSMLEEERSRMRLLQTEFQALKVSSVQLLEKIVQVPQVQTIEKIVTDEAALSELRQQLQQERQSNRLLQSDFDQFRLESEATVAKIKLQVSSSMEELQQRSFQLIHDHERLNKELSESRSRDTERELIIINLKQSIDFKEKRLQQLQSDLEDRDLLSRELSESKGKDAEREMTIANLKQSMDFKEQRLQQLQSDLESARIERDVRMRSESLLQGVESQQVEKLRQQLDDMSMQRDQLNKEVLSLQSVQMRLEREIEGLRASLEEEKLKSNGMTQLKDEHARLKMELFEWKGKDVEREMAMASLKQSADFKDQQIQRLNGDLEAVRIERDAGIQKGSLRLEQESEQVDKLRKQLEAASIQREELSQKLIGSERTIFSLRADVETEQGRAAALHKEVEAVRTESLDSARGSSEELMSSRRKLQEALDENEDLTATIQRSDQELIQLRSEKQAPTVVATQRPSKVDTTADGGLKTVKLERDVEDLIKHVGVAQQSLTSNGSKVTSLSFNDLRNVFDVQSRSI